MHRRGFLAATLGALAAPSLAEAATAGSAAVELRPGDVEVGDTAQELALTVTDIDDDVEELVVRIDVTPLAADANVRLADPAVEEERSEPSGAAEGTVDRESGRTVVELRIDPADDHYRGLFVLTGLATGDAAHDTELAYRVAVEADGEATTESAAFSVVDPALRTSRLELRLGRIEHGAAEQRFAFRALDLPTDPDELVVDVDVSRLERADVGLVDPSVAVDAAHDATVVDATVVELGDARVLRFVLEPDVDAESVQLTATLSGLDTEDAAHGVDVPYPARVSVDERPDAPPEADEDAATVSVVDTQRVTREPPDDAPQPDRTGTPPDEAGAADGNAVDGPAAGDGDAASGELPGFGPVAAIAGVVGAVAARLRWDREN